MKKWTVRKDLPLSVSEVGASCYGDDPAFQRMFHDFRGDTDLAVGPWKQCRGPDGVEVERHHQREITSRSALKAPVVVLRMLGDVPDALIRVTQRRAYEGRVEDGSLTMTVEQTIRIEGLPLETSYCIDTVARVRGRSCLASGSAVLPSPSWPKASSSCCYVEIEGHVQCKAGVGLRGVIEGILYSQSREASVLFLELLASSDCVEVACVRARDRAAALAQSAALSEDSYDSDDSSVVSGISWNSARS
eukprot:COSAG01_NODE_22043_length_874_cov_1.273548_1_plen_247_part_01